MTSVENSKSIAVLIVAAGRGTRLKSDVPKQYLPLEGPCALSRCVARFLELPAVGFVRVVIHPDDVERYESAVAGVSDARLLTPGFGGVTRAETTLNGLVSLEEVSPDQVLIHDAARPFVSHEVIMGVARALDQADGAFAALPVVDAIWSASEGRAERPVARENLWRAQTPQGFHFAKILAAHRALEGDASDDVAVARAAGLEVAVTPGDEANYKITLEPDLARARLFAKV